MILLIFVFVGFVLFMLPKDQHGRGYVPPFMGQLLVGHAAKIVRTGVTLAVLGGLALFFAAGASIPGLPSLGGGSVMGRLADIGCNVGNVGCPTPKHPPTVTDYTDDPPLPVPPTVAPNTAPPASRPTEGHGDTSCAPEKWYCPTPGTRWAP